ncbi:(2Fe-2S) ferredoxin domain-containing protein [Flavobacterium sediminilitoris]|uniref:(2Fe-2S) ferredoxin domain-containing protein n=1 Tax=Flavobacterium sediminilitoris TaxID=2024526 RepID=A0ABY4HQ81_9FLAO|nr:MULTISPECIES: (2Fe-2S) ferredoxin domain-containing protein [Flavobacterium]UOX34457.1 (2Fe-2S) ferredoxin domain-containing protein [Flavobacterium sediminilitoris]
MSKIEFPAKALFLCNGSKCGKHKEIRKHFKTVIKENHLKKEIEIFKMECSDRCKNAPILYCQSENEWFEKVDLDKAKNIINKMIL